MPRARVGKDAQMCSFAQRADVCASGRGGWICLPHFFRKHKKKIHFSKYSLNTHYSPIRDILRKIGPTHFLPFWPPLNRQKSASRFFSHLSALWDKKTAPLNRKKHAPHVFIHKHRILAKVALPIRARSAFYRVARAAPLNRQKSASRFFSHKPCRFFILFSCYPKKNA